jgi:chromosome segregation ATPase
MPMPDEPPMYDPYGDILSDSSPTNYQSINSSYPPAQQPGLISRSITRENLQFHNLVNDDTTSESEADDASSTASSFFDLKTKDSKYSNIKVDVPREHCIDDVSNMVEQINDVSQQVSDLRRALTRGYGKVFRKYVKSTKLEELVSDLISKYDEIKNKVDFEALRRQESELTSLKEQMAELKQQIVQDQHHRSGDTEDVSDEESYTDTDDIASISDEISLDPTPRIEESKQYAQRSFSEKMKSLNADNDEPLPPDMESERGSYSESESESTTGTTTTTTTKTTTMIIINKKQANEQEEKKQLPETPRAIASPRVETVKQYMKKFTELSLQVHEIKEAQKLLGEHTDYTRDINNIQSELKFLEAKLNDLESSCNAKISLERRERQMANEDFMTELDICKNRIEHISSLLTNQQEHQFELIRQRMRDFELALQQTNDNLNLINNKLNTDKEFEQRWKSFETNYYNDYDTVGKRIDANSAHIQQLYDQNAALQQDIGKEKFERDWFEKDISKKFTEFKTDIDDKIGNVGSNLRSMEKKLSDEIHQFQSGVIDDNRKFKTQLTQDLDTTRQELTSEMIKRDENVKTFIFENLDDKVSGLLKNRRSDTSREVKNIVKEVVDVSETEALQKLNEMDQKLQNRIKALAEQLQDQVSPDTIEKLKKDTVSISDKVRILQQERVAFSDLDPIMKQIEQLNNDVRTKSSQEQIQHLKEANLNFISKLDDLERQIDKYGRLSEGIARNTELIDELDNRLSKEIRKRASESDVQELRDEVHGRLSQTEFAEFKHFVNRELSTKSSSEQIREIDNRLLKHIEESLEQDAQLQRVIQDKVSDIRQYVTNQLKGVVLDEDFQLLGKRVNEIEQRWSTVLDSKASSTSVKELSGQIEDLKRLLSSALSFDEQIMKDLDEKANKKDLSGLASRTELDSLKRDILNNINSSEQIQEMEKHLLELLGSKANKHDLVDVLALLNELKQVSSVKFSDIEQALDNTISKEELKPILEKLLLLDTDSEQITNMKKKIEDLYMKSQYTTDDVTKLRSDLNNRLSNIDDKLRETVSSNLFEHNLTRILSDLDNAQNEVEQVKKSLVSQNNASVSDIDKLRKSLRDDLQKKADMESVQTQLSTLVSSDELLHLKEILLEGLHGRVSVEQLDEVERKLLQDLIQIKRQIEKDLIPTDVLTNLRSELQSKVSTEELLNLEDRIRGELQAVLTKEVETRIYESRESTRQEFTQIVEHRVDTITQVVDEDTRQQLEYIKNAVENSASKIDYEELRQYFEKHLMALSEDVRNIETDSVSIEQWNILIAMLSEYVKHTEFEMKLEYKYRHCEKQLSDIHKDYSDKYILLTQKQNDLGNHFDIKLEQIAKKLDNNLNRYASVAYVADVLKDFVSIDEMKKLQIRLNSAIESLPTKAMIEDLIHLTSTDIDRLKIIVEQHALAIADCHSNSSLEQIRIDTASKIQKLNLLIEESTKNHHYLIQRNEQSTRQELLLIEKQIDKFVEVHKQEADDMSAIIAQLNKALQDRPVRSELTAIQSQIQYKADKADISGLNKRIDGLVTRKEVTDLINTSVSVDEFALFRDTYNNNRVDFEEVLETRIITSIQEVNRRFESEIQDTVSLDELRKLRSDIQTKASSQELIDVLVQIKDKASVDTVNRLERLIMTKMSQEQFTDFEIRMEEKAPLEMVDQLQHDLHILTLNSADSIDIARNELLQELSKKASADELETLLKKLDQLTLHSELKDLEASLNKSIDDKVSKDAVTDLLESYVTSLDEKVSHNVSIDYFTSELDSLKLNLDNRMKITAEDIDANNSALEEKLNNISFELKHKAEQSDIEDLLARNLGDVSMQLNSSINDLEESLMKNFAKAQKDIEDFNTLKDTFAKQSDVNNLLSKVDNLSAHDLRNLMDDTELIKKQLEDIHSNIDSSKRLSQQEWDKVIEQTKQVMAQSELLQSRIETNKHEVTEYVEKTLEEHSNETNQLEGQMKDLARQLSVINQYINSKAEQSDLDSTIDDFNHRLKQLDERLGNNVEESNTINNKLNNINVDINAIRDNIDANLKQTKQNIDGIQSKIDQAILKVQSSLAMTIEEKLNDAAQRNDTTLDILRLEQNQVGKSILEINANAMELSNSMNNKVDKSELNQLRQLVDTKVTQKDIDNTLQRIVTVHPDELAHLENKLTLQLKEKASLDDLERVTNELVDSIACKVDTEEYEREMQNIHRQLDSKVNKNDLEGLVSSKELDELKAQVKKSDSVLTVLENRVMEEVQQITTTTVHISETNTEKYLDEIRMQLSELTPKNEFRDSLSSLEERVIDEVHQFTASVVHLSEANTGKYIDELKLKITDLTPKSEFRSLQDKLYQQEQQLKESVEQADGLEQRLDISTRSLQNTVQQISNNIDNSISGLEDAMKEQMERKRLLIEGGLEESKTLISDVESRLLFLLNDKIGTKEHNNVSIRIQSMIEEEKEILLLLIEQLRVNIIEQGTEVDNTNSKLKEVERYVLSLLNNKLSQQDLETINKRFAELRRQLDDANAQLLLKSTSSEHQSLVNKVKIIEEEILALKKYLQHYVIENIQNIYQKISREYLESIHSLESRMIQNNTILTVKDDELLQKLEALKSTTDSKMIQLEQALRNSILQLMLSEVEKITEDTTNICKDLVGKESLALESRFKEEIEKSQSLNELNLQQKANILSHNIAELDDKVTVTEEILKTLLSDREEQSLDKSERRRLKHTQLQKDMRYFQDKLHEFEESLSTLSHSRTVIQDNTTIIRQEHHFDYDDLAETINSLKEQVQSVQQVGNNTDVSGMIESSNKQLHDMIASLEQSLKSTAKRLEELEKLMKEENKNLNSKLDKSIMDVTNNFNNQFESHRQSQDEKLGNINKTISMRIQEQKLAVEGLRDDTKEKITYLDTVVHKNSNAIDLSQQSLTELEQKIKDLYDSLENSDKKALGYKQSVHDELLQALIEYANNRINQEREYLNNIQVNLVTHPFLDERMKEFKASLEKDLLSLDSPLNKRVIEESFTPQSADKLALGDQFVKVTDWVLKNQMFENKITELEATIDKLKRDSEKVSQTVVPDMSAFEQMMDRRMEQFARDSEEQMQKQFKQFNDKLEQKDKDIQDLKQQVSASKKKQDQLVHKNNQQDKMLQKHQETLDSLSQTVSDNNAKIQDLQSRLKRSENDQENLNKKVSALEDQLKKDNTTQVKNDKQLKDLAKDIKSYTDQFKNLQQSIPDKKQLDSAKKENALNLKQSLSDLEKKFAQQIAKLQKESEKPNSKLTLDVDGLEKLVNKVRGDVHKLQGEIDQVNELKDNNLDKLKDELIKIREDLAQKYSNVTNAVQNNEENNNQQHTELKMEIHNAINQINELAKQESSVTETTTRDRAWGHTLGLMFFSILAVLIAMVYLDFPSSSRGFTGSPPS